MSPRRARVVRHSSVSASASHERWRAENRAGDFLLPPGKQLSEAEQLLADLAETSCGFALQTSGRSEIPDALTPDHGRATREKIRTKFAGPSSTLTPLQRLMKWSVSDPRRRTISPFSNLTVPEWIENRINEEALEDLRAALQLNPDNALLSAQFGRRLAEQAFEQGTDPDEARRARGEADFQTRRAQGLAPDNGEVEKLRAEVV